ncbi:MAG TPA: glucosidase, partial [Gammaproteobacteria bacterium]|nr:glucosidase [Gammaproteobacteria bacterium]
MKTTANAEQNRLKAQHKARENWRLWGPYLAERAWGTVREDYSADGEAWDYFNHEQAPARAYRWNEDGLGGICDEQQRLCFAVALWNGRDPILKERAFGLDGNQGNHGEDVKEYYFYRDATPSHSWLRFLYKYPQAAFPYEDLVEENLRRDRQQPGYNLLDTGVFDESRYWDVEVFYAKASPDQIHIRIKVTNRGPDAATLHLLPQLWFRNTWSWENETERPQLAMTTPPDKASFAVSAEHSTLGDYFFYGSEEAQLLFTENESNQALLWGDENPTPYVKDAFHRFLINDEKAAINPASQGSKCAAWMQIELAGGEQTYRDFVLSARALRKPFAGHDKLLALRYTEADRFYEQLLPGGDGEDLQIMRQALAGMIWNKQFYHFDVDRWLQGDLIPPPEERKKGRNHAWRHLRAADIISMPDSWEYPWFAAWDLAYHCATLALFDVDFAKDQIELMLSERYLHPNGQIPAYEWDFSDVNPPVQAMGALKVFRGERIQRGEGDISFLQRVFHKLLLNYSWWINRKDKDGLNLFEGGFLGLDNISVYDRSESLPRGYNLRQADATGWMAMFSLNMTAIALEITTRHSEYEDIAIQCYEQFLALADAIAGGGENGLSLWDAEAGFFKDVITTPEGVGHHIDVYSWVGLIPLFACEVIDQRLLKNAPRFRKLLQRHKGGLFHGKSICACPAWENGRGEHLLALVDERMLPRILERLLDETQFLSPHGVRSLSRVHAKQRDL